MDVPNTTPDMEDNADTEVVERKNILEVNVGTSDNINVISFKDGRKVIQTQCRQELLIKPLMEK